MSLLVLTLVPPQSTWWTPLAQTCKAPRISVKRGARHGVVAVRWLELTERAGRVARPRDLLEPAAGGRGMAATTGGSTASSSSISNRRAGWPHCGTEVSTTTCPCALRCPAWRLADVFDACGRPRVQEMVSEASWHLFFIRRASTPWSCFGSRGSPLSAMQSRGGLCMSGMGAGELCEGPFSSVPALCVLASGRSRTCCCGVSWRLCGICHSDIFVVPACRVESMSIA